MIPSNYEEWKHCIVRDCRIKLTKDFVAKRLKVYKDRRNAETKKFIELYGEHYLNSVIYWFEKSEKEIAQGN